MAPCSNVDDHRQDEVARSIVMPDGLGLACLHLRFIHSESGLYVEIDRLGEHFSWFVERGVGNNAEYVADDEAKTFAGAISAAIDAISKVGQDEG